MDEARTETLVGAIATGDDLAIEELVDACLPRLHAYVRLHMGPDLRSREDSLDIVQSVCREALGDLRDGFEYRGRGAFLRWLFTAALNKMRNRHRDVHRQKRDVRREQEFASRGTAGYEDLFTPSRAAIGREELQQLEQAFDRLPPDYQEVITLARVVGLTHKEIAAEMGRPENSTRTLLGRAIARLGQLQDRAE